VGFKEKRDTCKNGRGSYGVVCELQNKSAAMTGILEEFNILVGVHQGSVPSPLLFIIVLDKFTKEIRKGVPWN